MLFNKNYLKDSLYLSWMIEVVVKGRGGQGAKTAVEVLARAANHEDKFFLAYPEFGPERSGTPINAYFKLNDTLVRSRSPIKSPDIILVLDTSLDKFASGIKKKGMIIVNSVDEKKYHFVDAEKIAKEIVGRSLPNIIMLGALVKITKILKKESVEKAIKDSFKGKIADMNLKCFDEGFKNAK